MARLPNRTELKPRDASGGDQRTTRSARRETLLPSVVQILDSKGVLTSKSARLSEALMLEGLRAMLLGRRFDERCVNLQRRGLMVTLAPGIGQEACSVGSAMALERSTDWFVPQYREAAGQLFYGLPLVQAFLWHMGSPLGFLIPPGLRMLPFQAAVAGQIPHAVGLAWGLASAKEAGCGGRAFWRGCYLPG